jgi:hypothetical protein
MNELANELIKEIVMLGEKASVPTSRSPGQVWKTKGGFGAMNPSKKIDYFTDRKTAQAYADGRPVGKTQEPAGKKKKIGSMGTDVERDRVKKQAATSLRGQSTVLTVPKKPKGFADQQLYDTFVKLLNGNNVSKLQDFINKHQIKYNSDKDTFYVNVDSKNNVLTGDDRKIFGDSKSTRSVQRVIFDRLQQMGITFQSAASGSPFSPDRIAPPSTRRKFDGTVEGSTITFNGVQYEALPEANIDSFVKTQYDSWLKGAGKNSTPAQQREFKEKLAVAAFGISQRHRVLSVLAEGQDKKGPEAVAVYDTDESKSEFIGSLQKAVVGSLNQTRQRVVNKMFGDLQKTTDAKEAERIMTDILSEISKDESAIFRQSGVIPSIAENFTTILEMKRGRTVIVPLRSNFKASDVISLSGEETSGLSASKLVEQVKSIYVGISVKFLEGGASSMGEKTRQSVFKAPFKQTKDALTKLSKAASEVGSLFDTDPQKKKARRDEVKAVMSESMEEICKYYGITPVPKNVDKLIDFLKHGPPECVGGKVVPRRNAPSPLSKGTDKQGQPIDTQAWGMTFAMQASWDAIYNSNVIGQAFASQTWTRQGLVEVDGLTSQAKQVMQPFKEARGKGMQYQPDNLVSKNKPVQNREQLRDGNPCGKKGK